MHKANILIPLSHILINNNQKGTVYPLRAAVVELRRQTDLVLGSLLAISQAPNRELARILVPELLKVCQAN